MYNITDLIYFDFRTLNVSLKIYFRVDSTIET